MRRKIMTKTQQANYPYFGMGSNNAVVLLYVIHPELLAMDDVSKRGRPFLFYVGSHFQDKSGREIADGFDSSNPLYPYVGKVKELTDLLNGRCDGFTAEWLKVKPALQMYDKLPERVLINGKEVETKNLSSGWVPFSFGVGHEYEHKRFKETNGRNVRLDLDEFKAVLGQYEVQKAAREAREATLGYRLQRFFGRGLER